MTYQTMTMTLTETHVLELLGTVDYDQGYADGRRDGSYDEYDPDLAEAEPAEYAMGYRDGYADATVSINEDYHGPQRHSRYGLSDIDGSSAIMQTLAVR